jgi:hypothetical protein
MLLQELRVACELGSEQTLSRAKDKVDAVLNIRRTVRGWRDKIKSWL